MGGWTPGFRKVYVKRVPGNSGSMDPARNYPAKILSIVLHYDSSRRYIFPDDMSFSFTFTDVDDKQIVYRAHETRGCLATDYRSGSISSSGNMRAMNRKEIERLCRLFSAEIGDFDSIRYSFGHLMDDFFRPNSPSEYKHEKAVRSVLKEKMEESLTKIKESSGRRVNESI